MTSWFTVACKPCGKTWGVALEHAGLQREQLRERAIAAKAWVLERHQPECRA